MYTINWSWSAVVGADGYRVSITNNYECASGCYADSQTNSFNQGSSVLNYRNFSSQASTFTDAIAARGSVSLSGGLYFSNSPNIYSDGFAFITSSSTRGSIGIGYGALSATSSTGRNSIALGTNAFKGTIIGTQNIAIGKGAFGSTTTSVTGSNNIALGTDAGFNITSGAGNIFVGTQTGITNTVGYDNTFVGHFAGINNTTGYSNAFVGSFAGHNSTTGGGNTFVGPFAGYYNSTGSSNAFVGAQAGQNNTTGTSSSALGNFAGYTNTIGRSNLWLGDEADSLLNNLTNATAIGSKAKVGASNSLVLGGTGAWGVKVGIGTTSPTSKLSIVGTAGSSDNLLTIASSTGTSLFTVLANSNVGIGTTSPPHPLTMGSGAHVTTGGVWTNASDRNLKENFTKLDPVDILNRVTTLTIEQWNYKNESGEITHVGPTAQDFFALFNLGGSDTSISTIDPSGIALLAIQGLDLKLESLASSTPQTESFAGRFFANLRSWFANAENGITAFFAKNITTEQITTDTLCVGGTCVTEAQLQALLSQSGEQPPPADTNFPEENTDNEAPSTDEIPEDTGTTTESVPSDVDTGENETLPPPDLSTDSTTEPEATPEPVETPPSEDTASNQ